MNLLENTTTTKKQFTSLAKGATYYSVFANGINKDFENIKDAIATFEMICEISEGKLTIVKNTVQSNAVTLSFSFFRDGEITNRVVITAGHY